MHTCIYIYNGCIQVGHTYLHASRYTCWQQELWPLPVLLYLNFPNHSQFNPIQSISYSIIPPCPLFLWHWNYPITPDPRQWQIHTWDSVGKCQKGKNSTTWSVAGIDKVRCKKEHKWHDRECHWLRITYTLTQRIGALYWESRIVDTIWEKNGKFQNLRGKQLTTSKMSSLTAHIYSFLIHCTSL